MNKKLLRRYSFKWDPFLPDLPVSALWKNSRISLFLRRIERMSEYGGFGLIWAHPGLGKSVTLRAIEEALAALPGVIIGILSRTQASLADFYRELGHIFAVSLSPSNRWGGYRTLRERWQAHIDETLYRPVLLVDEAQLIRTEVFSELRLLASAELDSKAILTVILAGDYRLIERLQDPDLAPLESRIRARLCLDPFSPDELKELLIHVLGEAGNPHLMTTDVIDSLVEHAAGNPRTMMMRAHDLLLAADDAEASQIDEELYFKVFAPPSRQRPKARSKKGGAR